MRQLTMILRIISLLLLIPHFGTRWIAHAGDAGDNGVNVTFMNKVDKADDNGVTRNQAGTAGWTYDDVSNTFKQATQVDIKAGLRGNTLEETAVHEGVHVEDRSNFISSFSVVMGPNYSVHSNDSLDILGRQSEVNAFTVQNLLRQSLGEAPIDIPRTLSRPPYSNNPSMNRPIISTVPQLGGVIMQENPNGIS